nr:MAG TPA: hypothetical protein [Bacteriophage sp.]
MEYSARIKCVQKNTFFDRKNRIQQKASQTRCFFYTQKEAIQ